MSMFFDPWYVESCRKVSAIEKGEKETSQIITLGISTNSNDKLVKVYTEGSA